MGKIKSSILIEKSKCGIRDPLLWSGNSSSYGRLTEYNPSGNYSSEFILNKRLKLIYTTKF